MSSLASWLPRPTSVRSCWQATVPPLSPAFRPPSRSRPILASNPPNKLHFLSLRFYRELSRLAGGVPFSLGSLMRSRLYIHMQWRSQGGRGGARPPLGERRGAAPPMRQAPKSKDTLKYNNIVKKWPENASREVQKSKIFLGT